MFHYLPEGTMRYNVLLVGLVLMSLAGVALANGDGKGNDEQRRSIIFKGDNNGSYPRPFPIARRQIPTLTLQ